MPKPSLIAVTGAAAIAGGLIGVAALSQTAPTRTRDVALVAGEADIFLPQLNTFMPESANGFPPFADVLQGTELWNLVNRDEIEYLTGTDTQTTVGSFVNDDFFELAGHNMFETPPAPGSEIDLANFGGGYEVEWARLYDAAGGSSTTDTVITPFGNYTIPLGTTTAAGAAALPAVVDGYSFADFTAAIHNTVAAGEQWFTEAATAFTAGEYPLALSEELAGFNNLTVGVTNDVLTNGYAVLTASDGNAGFALENVGQPADFTAGLSDAQLFLANAQSDVGLALTEFANGNIYFGLTDLASSNTESVFATDAIILGLFDSLPGMVFTS